MTEQQRVLYERAHRRVAMLQPDVAAAVLVSFRIITASLSESQLAKLIADGAVDQIVTVLLSAAIMERATLPLRQALRRTIEQSYKLNIPYLPRGGKIDGTVAVFFDRLNPRVIDAIRGLETRVITTLHENTRATVIQAVERGITEGKNPRATARYVREIIGLSPRGEEAVSNFRKMLEAGDREALTRLLRDKRFDKTLERAFAGDGLTAEQVTRMTDAYRRKALAYEAESISRTATLDAYKVAQRESWQSAIDRGIVEPGRLMRQWIGVDDERERDTHRALNNEIVPFDQPYSSGQMYPGQGEYGCRCIDRFFIARAA